MTGNATVVNFSGGETSPRSRGRFDQPWYQTSFKKGINFISELQGPARFRPGFVFCRQTRKGQPARLIHFHVNDVLSYILEFTPGFMRVYDLVKQDLLTSQSVAVLGITAGNPAQLTVSGPGFANGTELIFSPIAGMPQMSNRQLVIANAGGSQSNLADPVTGALLDTTGFGGPLPLNAGTVSVVYEIPTPYTAADLKSLDGKGVENLMYLVCPTQPPQKLTVDSNGVFTLGPYSRTSDPFAPAAPTLNIAGILRSVDPFVGQNVLAGLTLITLAPGQYPVSTAHYTFAGVVGTVQINGGIYRIVPGTISVNIGATGGFATQFNVLYLQTLAGQNVDSSAWSAYVSGGTAAANSENPLAVAFYEGRLVFAGTNQRPDCLFLSRAPNPSSGVSRYDDFTGGSNAADACFFQFAPVGGDVAFISWANGGPDYLFVGTFGGPFRVSGSGLDIPITPSSINVRQFDTAGCEETPPAGLAQMFFIQRAGVSVRSIRVINPYLATFESADLCLNAEQVGYSPIQRIGLQRGRPDCLWVSRADGTLWGMSVHITVQNADILTGWHRHEIGGPFGSLVLDLVISQRQTGLDQVWVVTQRTLNGVARCFVEVMADDVYFPDPEDFFGSSGVIVAPSKNPQQQDTQAGLGSKAADLLNWMNAVWRLQGNYVHMDAELAYDGSLRGINAGATLTPSAVGAAQIEGQAAVPITLTASQPVFLASDVGSEIWIKPDLVTGQGAGRATITAYVSPTQVTAVVTVPFSSVSAFAAGDWYFAVSTFYGFSHLEGQQVAVVADGAVISDGGQTGGLAYPNIVVINGVVALPAGNIGQQPRAAVLRVGLPYVGLLETHNLEMGGRSGPAQAKPRNISEIFIRFMNSLGVEFGTSLYNLAKIEHRLSNAVADRPPPVFSGLQRVKMEDSWTGLDDYTREKNVVVCQRLPVPCVVESLDMFYDTSEDQSAP